MSYLTQNAGVAFGTAAIGGASNWSLDNTRRLYDFGNRVAELSPMETVFFTYLSKTAKRSSDDPNFKFLEQRHQWQRRNFNLKGAVTDDYTAESPEADNMKLDCLYDNYGKEVSTPTTCPFLINGQVIMLKDTGGTKRYFRIHAAPDHTADSSTATQVDLTPLFTSSGDITFADNTPGQVVGSAYAEGGTTPDGWNDNLSANEGWMQIFKTAIKLHSGTSQATRYRGRPNEFMRQWVEKLKEHKMDIEYAMLAGYGYYDSTNDIRHTWGIVPYTEAYGKTYPFSYANSSYDTILETMENFFAPESGNSGPKLCMASRKIISWFNKLGSGNFISNTTGGSSQFRVDMQNIKGKFGHNLMKVSTVFGDLYLVQQPLFRGVLEDTLACVDLKNVAYRPLVGNGISRDTFIKTNVQDNNRDGRQDEIITEAGLEISLPETHSIWNFS